MSKKKLGIAIALLLIVIMIWSSLKGSGFEGLSVKFEEQNFVRNENNTGPVIRRYLVTISDTLWDDLESYGNLMPYSKLGMTEVYYFLEGSDFHQSLNLKGEPFAKSFQSNLVAVYSKNNMGTVNLKKYH